MPRGPLRGLARGWLCSVVLIILKALLRRDATMQFARIHQPKVAGSSKILGGTLLSVLNAHRNMSGRTDNPMSKSAQFREYARNCVRLAEVATAGSHRAMMLSMADTWLKFADQEQREAELEADDRDVRLSPATRQNKRHPPSAPVKDRGTTLGGQAACLDLRSTVERSCDTLRSFRQAFSAARPTVREAKALVARSQGKPYLATEAGHAHSRAEAVAKGLALRRDQILEL